MTSKTTALTIVTILGLIVGGSVAEAGIVSLTADSLDGMLGGGVSQIAGPLTVDVSAGNMVAEVCSSAYTGENGLYVYLYQLSNTGVAGNSSIDTFTIFPFWGASDYSQIGYLTSVTDTNGEFATGGLDPLPDGYIDGSGTGPVISFYYSKEENADIPYGEHSKVLYVKSDRSPANITGNVIDGAVGTGTVLGAVPEPSTLITLLLGFLGLTAFRGTRRR